MNKFWEWMTAIGIYDNEHDECRLPDGGSGILTNQMLIGYMIEYLLESGYFLPLIINETIEQYYDRLSERIEKIERGDMK